jgi:hypothetical protein
MKVNDIKEMLEKAKEQNIKSNYIYMTEGNHNELVKELIDNKLVDSEEFLLIDGKRFESNKLEDGTIEIHLLD